jgi:hypothetical protein
MNRIISISFSRMLISTTQALFTMNLKPTRTGHVCRTRNTMACVKAQLLSYYCSYCRSLLITPHFQDVLMLPMQLTDTQNNTTIICITSLQIISTRSNMCRSCVIFIASSATCKLTRDGNKGYILLYTVHNFIQLLLTVLRF